MALIELKNISKIYVTGEVETRALDNVSLQIEKGEFVAIMGPSGSGKSTLMHIMGLLDTPTHGEYLLNDKPVHTLKERQLAKERRKGIGFVFQSFNLVPRLSATQNVQLPMLYAGTSRTGAKKKAVKLLEQLDLGDHVHKHPNQMSGGQIQRVAIARALANNPHLILADEPTGNLDTTTGNKIMDKLKEIHKAGSTVVMITHDQRLAKMAQRIIHLKDGEVEKGGK